jgi:hypothetical protein
MARREERGTDDHLESGGTESPAETTQISGFRCSHICPMASE